MIRISENFDLSHHNTFGMNVMCACYVEYDRDADLKKLEFNSFPQPIVCIGEGSNLLFTGHFPGTILRSCIKYISYEPSGLDEVCVSVGSGVIFDDFVADTCSHHLWGVENLSLIPGQVGAAAVQNIGAYGVEVKDILQEVICYDTREQCEVHFDVDDCRYSYRGSRFKEFPDKGSYIVTGVRFKLHRTSGPNLEYRGLKDAFGSRMPETPQEVREAVIRIRNKKLPDPAKIGSAGSFFKNPVVPASSLTSIARASGGAKVPYFSLPGDLIKIPAAWLIEQCSLKGFQTGGAAVYELQPLVLVNLTGKATPSDVLALEKEVTRRVKVKFGIELQAEVEHI